MEVTVNNQQRKCSGGDFSEREKGAWPPCCCVAAFVAAALENLGHANIGHESLAHKLDISVAPSSHNPWGLRVEADPHLQGLTVAAATERIPRLLRSVDAELTFRHILFSHVTLGLVEEVLVQATLQGCVVGVGYDLGLMGGTSSTMMRHVARIEPASDSEHVVILNDSEAFPPQPVLARWSDLLPAVSAVTDGFWLVGPRKSMNLAYTP
jgi:hypothetical protein